MFCVKCGSEVPLGAKFCPKCGHPAIPATQEASQPAVIKLKKNLAKRLFFIALGLLALLIIITIASAFLESSQAIFIIRLINIVLALLGLLSVVGIPIGIVVAIILSSKKEKDSINREYYGDLSLWSAISPFMIIVLVILAFVIVRVVSNATSLNLPE